MALSALWQEGLSFPRIALRNLHFFFLKMLITATTVVTFPVFAVSFAISSAFIATLRAVSTPLIYGAYVTNRLALKAYLI